MEICVESIKTGKSMVNGGVIASVFHKQREFNMGQRSALVCGAGGFIGDHLVRRLKDEGFWVRGVDLKMPRFRKTAADDFMVADLRDRDVAGRAIDRRFDEIYQLAADMGGAGFVFTGENDADIMHNSAMINP